MLSNNSNSMKHSELVISSFVPLNIVRMNMKPIQHGSVTCCICKYLPGKFMPIQCVNRTTPIAHKICADCWWDEEKGFALETNCHKCPGCIVTKNDLSR